MSEPRAIDLSNQPPVWHDAGITDRELVVDNVRWALVEYGVAQGRRQWCDTPHCGFVVSGAVRYEFVDGREALLVRRGSAFVLPPAPAHRGSCEGAETARLFIIDALPDQRASSI
jgi:quercetin dioxygenase-like cupin family protein